MGSPLHIRTPLAYSPFLSARTGSHVYLKLENTQPSGSFKSRGVGALASASFAKYGSSAHLVCSSGGNAGLACAYAGSALGLRVTICVPRTTRAEIVRRIQAYGAEVIEGGDHWLEADQGARKFVAEQPEAVYVPPFDHPVVVEGNSTIVPEIAEQLAEQGASKLAAVLCSVGGGGLLSGILTGMQASEGRLEVPVIACETSGAASFALSSKLSFAATPPTPTLGRLDGITSIASTLGAVEVSQQVINLTVKHTPGVASVVVEDERTIDIVRRFLDDHAFFVEPACAVALSPLYDPAILSAALPSVNFSRRGETPPKDAPSLVVVVCGGNSVTLEKFLAWEKEFEGRKLGPTSIFCGARGIDVEL